MSDYTPGPWTVTDEGFVVAGDAGSDFAVVSTDEAHANAVLIAAAPEMLEALIEAAGHLTAYIEAEYCDHHGRGLCQCKPDIVARLTNLIRRAKGDAA